jgi:UDP-glucose 4-epimerase
MHIFVTGATGFVGSYFVRLAISSGHKVSALRRENSSKPKIYWPSEPCWIDSSILDLKADQLRGINAIAHFAAAGVSPRASTWQELEKVNVHSTLHLCELAKIIGARISISGSFAEYGLSGNRFSLIPPNAPLEPTFPYAASKAASSVLATSFARSEGLQLAYLRISNTYGDGQFEGNLWPSLRTAALSGENFPLTPGEQIRDFIDVETVAKWFLASINIAIQQPKEPLVINVGSGNPQTIASFCQYWWKEWKASGQLQIGALPYREGEVMRYVPEINLSLLNL